MKDQPKSFRIKSIEIFGYQISIIIMLLFLLFYGCKQADYVDELIQQLYAKTDPHSRMEAFDKLCGSTDERVINEFILILNNKNPMYYDKVLNCLRYTSEPRVINALIKCLEDKNTDVQVKLDVISLLESRGKTMDSIVTIPLIGILVKNDIEIKLKKTSINALGKIRDSRAVNPLINCLLNDSLKYDAVEALGELRDTTAVVPLIDCLSQKESSLKEKSTVIVALGKIMDPRAVVPLIRLLSNTNLTKTEKCSLIEALGNIGDARAVDPIISFIKDEELLREAVVALGNIGVAKAIPYVVNTLPDWYNNDVIFDALKNLKWSPGSEKEQIYYFIYKKDKRNLIYFWESSKNVLLADLKSGNQRKIENAVYTFISLGRDETINELIKILNTNGNEKIAKAFLNCGQYRLQEAAKKWVTSHGYVILDLPSNKDYSMKWDRW